MMNTRIGALMRTAILAAVYCALTLPSARAQMIVRSFDGDTGPDQQHCNPEEVRCGRQAEMNAAASGKQVVQVTWQHVNIYDYHGKLLRSTMLPDFIRKAGLDPNPQSKRPNVKDPGPFEPHIVFDEFIGRWIMNLTCLNDCFMVSASADAGGPWHGVYLSCLQGGPCLDNDPSLQLGYDKNGIYHCAGHLGDENPNTIHGVAYDCFAIPPSEVKEIGNSGREPTHLNRKHNMVMHIRPAVDQVVKTDVGSHQDKWLYNLPCCGKNSSVPQAGTDIRVRAQESHRLNNLVQYGSHLQAVFGSGPCTHDCGAQGEDKNNIMFWADLDCTEAAACKVAQTAKISSGDVSPLFPTIGVDGKGNVGIVAASSSEKDYLSILLWTHRATDPPNTFSAPVTVIAGTKPYTCPNNLNLALIASAVGMLTVRDPLDASKLWTTHQYSGDATPCVWKSRIIQYQPGWSPSKAQPPDKS